MCVRVCVCAGYKGHKVATYSSSSSGGGVLGEKYMRCLEEAPVSVRHIFHVR